MEYNKPFKVKITKSKHKDTWYKNSIGSYHIVCNRQGYESYYMVYKNVNGRGIWKEDAVIIEEFTLPKEMFEI